MKVGITMNDFMEVRIRKVQKSILGHGKIPIKITINVIKTRLTNNIKTKITPETIKPNHKNNLK